MISRYDRLDSLHRVEQITDGGIVVQRVDDIGDILAHIAVDIPLPAEQFRGLVDQICGQDTADGTLFVSLVKPIQPGGKKSEGGEDENFSSFALF